MLILFYPIFLKTIRQSLLLLKPGYLQMIFIPLLCSLIYQLIYILILVFVMTEFRAAVVVFGIMIHNDYHIILFVLIEIDTYYSKIYNDIIFKFLNIVINRPLKMILHLFLMYFQILLLIPKYIILYLWVILNFILVR